MMELKPCPFCGAGAEIHERFNSLIETARRKSEIPKTAKILRSVKNAGGRLYYEYKELQFVPRCSDTSCIGRISKAFISKDAAIEAWNGRAEE